MDFQKLFTLVTDATVQTLLMVFLSTFFSVLLGLPLGVLLCVTDPETGIAPKPVLNQILTRIVNILRSFRNDRAHYTLCFRRSSLTYSALTYFALKYDISVSDLRGAV